MRVIVMFDLPVLSSSQIREYNKFRKFLIKSGFLMMQESIYCKLALNATVVDGIVSNVKKNKPPQGLVQILTLTEKQYSKMEIIVGENTNSTLDDDRRFNVYPMSRTFSFLFSKYLDTKFLWNSRIHTMSFVES